MFVSGKSRTIFLPSNTLIHGISRDGSRNFNTRTCEHRIIGQLTMGARQTKNAPLSISDTLFQTSVDPEWGIIGQVRLLHSLHWVLLYLNLSTQLFRDKMCFLFMMASHKSLSP